MMNIKKSFSSIIFCLSYLEIPWTLQLIERSKPRNVLVISNIENILKQIKEIYPSIQTLSTQHVIVPNLNKNIFNFLLQIIKTQKVKRDFFDQFHKIKGVDVYFFFVAFGIFEAWVITILSKTNSIYYKPEIDISYFYKNNSIKSIINNYIYKINYKINFKLLKFNNDQYHAVTEDFLKKIHAENIKLPDNLNKVKSRVIKRYRIETDKLLLLKSLYIKNNGISENEFIEKNDKLINYLIKFIGENNIRFKNHPRYSNISKLENKLSKIPSYISGNLILDMFSVVIGDISSMIYEAANSNVLAISTLEYYYSRTEFIENYKLYFTKNLNKGKKVYYIKQISDLDKILKLNKIKIN